MRLPTFFLIGPSKAGTTTLYHALRQHPQVYMSPVKEPAFMAYDPAWRIDIPGARVNFPYTTLESYAALFAAAGAARAVGEASVQYWHSPPAPGNIKRCVPDARLITVLRHPVERLYSHYLMYRLSGEEPRTLAQVLRGEGAEGQALRLGQHWYMQIGCYHAHLQRYWQHFPRRQLGVFLFDDLKARPQAFLQSIFAFLDVDDTFVPDLRVRHNPSGVPRSRALHWLLQKRPWTTALRERLPWGLIGRPYGWLMGLKAGNLEKPPLDPDLRRQLLDYYREDTLRLQDALQRDLSAWLV